VPQWCALADEVAKRLGFYCFLLQVGVPLFELRLELLNLLKGPRVGDGGADVVTEELAPRTSLLERWSRLISSPEGSLPGSKLRWT